MKTIVLFMPYGSVGGMERLAAYQYKAYRAMGYTVKAVKIIGLSNDVVHFGEDEIVLSTRDFHEYSTLARFWLYLRIPFMMRRIIQKYAVDYTLSYGDMANVFSAVTLTDEYKIAGIHALKSVEFTAPSFLNRIFRKSFQTIYRRFQKVVCISEAIKNDLLEKCDYRFPENLQVIYNPHDISGLQEQMLQPLLNAEEEALFSHPTIVFIGRMSVQKAPWHLIQAFAILKKDARFAAVKLVLIGDGNAAVIEKCSSILAHHQLESEVVFLGRRANPYAYLYRSTVLALTSYYEGTPNVIVEAMATGTPIVSSNCTQGIAELMALSPPEETLPWVTTPAGLITPNFFKGVLDIPVTTDFTEEEYHFAAALAEVIDNTEKYRSQLKRHQSTLLDKFDLNEVASAYLKDTWSSNDAH
ncbi:MAG: glycosyltransferase [Flavobacterium sp.]|uniref:glycosyltransferase n=1 Tax=Flavobacterium sp. TaxID=239 RepID=UPI0022C64ED1|nr:glycosyltransferase [Flavobacterium sp.]MCZ8298013.1 glycosyltransferase [Flavobacterium sp.]